MTWNFKPDPDRGGVRRNPPVDPDTGATLPGIVGQPIDDDAVLPPDVARFSEEHKDTPDVAIIRQLPIIVRDSWTEGTRTVRRELPIIVGDSWNPGAPLTHIRLSFGAGDDMGPEKIASEQMSLQFGATDQFAKVPSTRIGLAFGAGDEFSDPYDPHFTHIQLQFGAGDDFEKVPSTQIELQFGADDDYEGRLLDEDGEPLTKHEFTVGVDDGFDEE